MLREIALLVGGAIVGGVSLIVVGATPKVVSDWITDFRRKVEAKRALKRSLSKDHLLVLDLLKSYSQVWVSGRIGFRGNGSIEGKPKGFDFSDQPKWSKVIRDLEAKGKLRLVEITPSGARVYELTE